MNDYDFVQMHARMRAFASGSPEDESSEATFAAGFNMGLAIAAADPELAVEWHARFISSAPDEKTKRFFLAERDAIMGRRKGRKAD